MDVLVEDEPEPVPPVPGCCPWQRRGLGDRRGQLSLCPSRLWSPKLKPTCPRLALQCSTAWLGAGQLRGQPLCLERNPQEQRHLSGGGLAGLSFGPGARSQGARLLVVSLRSFEDLARDWGEVFVHCMAGRHRAALLVCVTLALLRGTSLAATETRRQIELNEVRSRDPQLWDWANRAVRGTRMLLQYPAPAAGWDHPLPPCPGPGSCIKSSSQRLLHQ